MLQPIYIIWFKEEVKRVMKENDITPLVSIVIPVYNVAEYLEGCMESVLQQTYKTLEIILVDDGSTDESGNLCDIYGQKDDRVKVVHKPNGGLSDARNEGIDIATGEYLYFLDSDDLIPEEAIDILVNIAEKSNCDVVIAGLQKFEDHVDKVSLSNQKFETVDHEEAMKRMFLHNGIGHEAWGKLYKRCLWKDIKFPVGKLYEDYASIYHVIAMCNSVSITQQKLYYYRIRQGSIMNTKIKNKELQILDVSNQVTGYIKESFPNLKEYAEYLQLVTYLKTMKRILDGGFNQYTEEQKIIMDYANSCKWIMKRDWVKAIDKIKFSTLLLNKHVFYCVYAIGEMKNRMNIM